jgi:NitT/TauT family transport system substrate-binding protein
MNRRTALALVPVMVSLSNHHHPAGAQELTKLRIATTPVDSSKAIFYAIKAGIYKKYGLEVETTMVNSGAAGAAALVGGAVDLAGVSVLTIFQAHLRGVPMMYTVPSILLSSDHVTTQTVVLKSSAIETGRDLNGKTIGSSSVGDINAAATLTWIASTGGDPKSVKIIEVPQSAAVAALQSGRVDAVTLNEPAVALALASGVTRTLAHPYDAIAKRLDAAGYAAMLPWIEKNADAVTRFERAMHESQAFTNTHLAETVDIVAGYSGIAPDVIAKSVRMIDPEYLDPRNFQPLIDALARLGYLERSFPASEIISPTALKPPR